MTHLKVYPAASKVIAYWLI